MKHDHNFTAEQLVEEYAHQLVSSGATPEQALISAYSLAFDGVLEDLRNAAEALEIIVTEGELGYGRAIAHVALQNIECPWKVPVPQ